MQMITGIRGKSIDHPGRAKEIAVNEKSKNLTTDFTDRTDEPVLTVPRAYAAEKTISPRRRGGDTEKSKTHYGRTIGNAGPKNTLPRARLVRHNAVIRELQGP
jgi:hypothetical protein